MSIPTLFEEKFKFIDEHFQVVFVYNIAEKDVPTIFDCFECLVNNFRE